MHYQLDIPSASPFRYIVQQAYTAATPETLNQNLGTLDRKGKLMPRNAAWAVGADNTSFEINWFRAGGLWEKI